MSCSCELRMIVFIPPFFPHIILYGACLEVRSNQNSIWVFGKVHKLCAPSSVRISLNAAVDSVVCQLTINFSPPPPPRGFGGLPQTEGRGWGVGWGKGGYDYVSESLFNMTLKNRCFPTCRMLLRSYGVFCDVPRFLDCGYRGRDN